MTLTSGDMHNNKARLQSAAKIAPISRRQAIMMRWKNEGNKKEDGGFGRGNNLLSILLLFRLNASF